MKFLAILLLLVIIPSAAIQKKECTKWSWTGDVYSRKVTCLEWRDKDQPKEKNIKK